MEAITANQYTDLSNERRRRLKAAQDARNRGHGGITAVARKTGMSRTTITKGIAELRNDTNFDKNRVRRPGGGRKRADQAQPDLLSALNALIEPTAKSKPNTPLRWTTNSTRRLCEMLNAEGCQVSHMQIGRLLHKLGYKLSTNRKLSSDGMCPDRNMQFEFINKQSAKFLKLNYPVIFVDASKNKLISDYRRDNKQDLRSKVEPKLEIIYNPSDEKRGTVIPYEGDDMRKFRCVLDNVGIDHDTAEFAVESIRRWWEHLGKELYPNAKELYIVVYSGGRNGNRSRLWKRDLELLADEMDLIIHVSHFPPGISKWINIKHRLYNHLWMKVGKELPNVTEVTIDLIDRTTRKTGLTVYAMHDKNIYPTRNQISDKAMAAINIAKNDTLGEWNYTIKNR